MEVEDTGKRPALFVSVYARRQSQCEILHKNMSFTYEVSRKAVIILRMSVSLRVVSSNPGVSIKTTRRPSILKAIAGCTLLVQDSNPSPMPRLAPLMRLINCENHGQARGKLMSCHGNTPQSTGKEMTTGAESVPWIFRFPQHP